jgi:aminocarboxymuconate-semialdehyde decarboxylase
MADDRLCIDMHTHILPQHLPEWKTEFGYGGFIRMQAHEHSDRKANMVDDNGKFFREVDWNVWDVNARKSDMDRCDVIRIVLYFGSRLPQIWHRRTGIVHRAHHVQLLVATARLPHSQ